VPGFGASSATLCAAGTFSATPGATACTPAPVDTYVDTAGATAPTPCPPGTWTNGGTGQIACVEITTRTVTSATGGGSIQVYTSAGGFSNVAAVDEASLPTAGKPAGVSFPFGFVSWTVSGLTAGQTIVVSIAFPDLIPVGAQYWKVIGTTWTDATSALGDDDGDAVLTLIITDGGPLDADGTANGQISDPGGPGQPAGGPLPQTINFTSPAPAGAAFGGPTYSPTAIATSGLEVALSIDASAAAVCSLTGADVSFIGVGTCVINANQAGDATYLAAPQVEQSFPVAKANQSITFGALANKTLDDPDFAIGATATSGLPVSFASLTTPVCTVAGTTVHLVAAGTCTIQASQAGDSNWNAASPVSQSFTVSPSSTGRPTTTSLFSNRNPSRYTQQVVFAAIVIRTSGTGVPTGTVTFRDGATVLATRTLVLGVAVYATSGLALGSHAITATYNPTGVWQTSSRSITQVVNPRTTSVDLRSNNNPSNRGQSVRFTAEVSSNWGTPTGTVTFRDGSTVLAVVAVNASGRATFTTSSLSRGWHTITAIYNPNSPTFLTSSDSLSQRVR
jgi:hypothetical protein